MRRQPFYAKIADVHAALETTFRELNLTGHGMADWPHGTLGFPVSKRQQRYVVPAGFKSTWVTVAL